MQKKRRKNKNRRITKGIKARHCEGNVKYKSVKKGNYERVVKRVIRVKLNGKEPRIMNVKMKQMSHKMSHKICLIRYARVSFH